MDSTLLIPFLIGFLCSFAPGTLFLLSWVSGHVRAQEALAATESKARSKRL